jgi:ATP-dependent Clp protease ATP-binding subunit ClpA
MQIRRGVISLALVLAACAAPSQERDVRAFTGTPVISKQLEIALHNSFVRAREKRQRWITVEHLLLQLVDDPSIRERLDSSGIDAVTFRSELDRYVSRTETFPSGESGDTEPTVAFQKAIQYAILRVQESGDAEVTPRHIYETVVAESKRLSLDPTVQRRLSSFK